MAFSPNRYYSAMVHHVASPNMMEVTIDMTLGVMLRRFVVMNGFSTEGINSDRAIHALVTIVGGRRVFLHADDGTVDGHIRCDIFTDAWRPSTPVAPMLQIPCCNNPVISVAAWMRWSASLEYDIRALRMALKD